MINFFNTTFEVSESNIDTAVLPLGSLEPKGPHLPVGLDMMLADRFSHDFSSGKAVYLLPTFPYSTAVEARGFRGTVALDQQTMWDILEDVARVLAKHRFKRLIVMDFANYNWIVKQIVREINLNHEIIQAVWVNPRQFAREAVDRALLPDFGGGAVETSLAMRLFGSLVRKPLKDFVPDAPREYVDYEGLAKISPQGYWGKPSEASASLGKKLYGIMLDKTREYVDYALQLFPGGAPLADHSEGELWWPGGEIPGIESGLDWRSTSDEISASGADVVVLPTSSIEQHSTSQPLATDYVQGIELSRGVARKLGAYLLPTMPFVTSWCHIKFRGTMTLRAMTVRRVLENAAASLHAGGWRKIALVNVHGGNWAIKPAIIEINRAYPDMRVVTTGDIFTYRGQAPVEELHANEGEGSFIKAFYPDCFKADRVVDYSPKCTASAFDLCGTGGVSPYGVWGYPSKSNAAAGRKAAREAVDEAAAHIGKAFADLEKRFGAK